MAQNLLSIDDKLHGFSVTNVRRIEELNGNLVEMTHESTGARLIWIDNSAENKLFSVGFKTLPEDSTGVFHILEHSVLCGSEKYPIKEPFVELLKTSMNTFLNAMTYPDKTIYPVSSRNTQDYLNLMSVYLDAVFSPKILENPDIFYQEGWHIDTTEGDPAYKGVVFNEMKGAMSDVDQLAERRMMKMLFPDSCYGHNSGGDPDAIVDLTYEKFIETYKRYYHPTNSYFYLDGDIPVDETLSRIDSYLSKYEKHHVLPRIVDQYPVIERRTLKYAANDDDDKAVVACGRILGSWKDRDNMYALSIVLEQLTDSNESPVKRAILSTGLAEDVEVYVSDGVYQPYLMMIFRGVSEAPKNASTLLQTACDAVRDAVTEGIPKRDIEASINQMDFRFREYPEPQALYRLNAAYASWLYDGDPAMYLKTNEAIDKLRKMADADEFKGLALELLADKSKYSTLCLVPDANLGSEEAKAEADFVKSTVKSMNDEERKALEDLNNNLLSWQQTPDADEDIARIPRLDVSSIDPMPELYETVEHSEGGTTVYHHPIATNGIVYISAYFPLTDLGIGELPAAALLTEFYKDMPTEKYNLHALRNEVRMYVGSLSFGLDILAKDRDNINCTPCLRVRASVLPDNLKQAEELIAEILLRTKFNDKSMMLELIKQIDEEAKRGAVSNGHRLAVYAARSHWTARDAATEAINGYSSMQYIHRMSEGNDADLDEFASFAKDAIDRCVNRQNMILSITSTDYVDMSSFINMLPEGEKMPVSVSYESKLPRRMGIRIPSSVSYAATAFDMNSEEYKMSGSMAVASSIISLSHLWNVIRVQGGAYGANMAVGRTGGMYCYTYRDPSPARSLDQFKTMADFTYDFASEGADIDGFIISTMAATDPLLSPGAKGKAADDFYFSEFADYDRIQFRKEILSTSAEDIQAQCDVLNIMEEKSTVCVAGPAEALDACPDLDIADM